MTGGLSVGYDTAAAPGRRVRPGTVAGQRKPAKRTWISVFGLLFLISTPTGAQAQGTPGDAQVRVNYDILTNLDWAASVSAKAALGERRTSLLLPAGQPPESRLLIEPAPVASRTPEPGTPAPAEEGTRPAPRTAAAPESQARTAALVPQPPPAEPGPPEPPVKDFSAPAPVRPAEPDSPELPVATTADALPTPVAPLAEPAAAVPAPAPQTAALPSGDQAHGRLVPGDLRLLFATSTAELSRSDEQRLVELADRLQQEQSRRIQIMSYASAVDENVSRARRLSLSRALAVRSFLIDKGVPSTRIDVRALGSNVGDGPADRIDVVDVRR